MINMAYIPLQITVKSADIFKQANFFSRMNLYAVASITDGGATTSSSTHSTIVNKRGGSHPFWWSNVQFQIQESKLMQEQSDKDDLTVTFSVMCRRVICPDEDIGQVRLHVKDLFQYYLRSTSSPDEDPRENVAFTIFSSRSGKLRGILKISYMFGSGDHKGIMRNRESAPTVQSAPYEDDLEPCDSSTNNSIQGYCGYDYNLPKPVPSAPYMSDEDCM